ncbi:MAG: Fic family protein, partial [Leptospiraceae bacterium]|nr:Fic family protein [Leptospiraceae bacterium]
MDIAEFKSGKLVSQGSYRFFLPEKINHSFFWNDESINELLEKASLKLGELNSFSRLVPNSDMFIIMHVFKEAVVSSRIEGTNTNIEEAFKGEKDIEPEKRNDWSEIQNYVDALNFAIEDLKTLPISSRLLRNAHKNLMTSVRGMNKNPGMFRKSQNWVGGASLMDAVFVPPIQNEVSGLIEDLENFLNNENIKIPHLIRIAIAHYQFETIHPFLD